MAARIQVIITNSCCMQRLFFLLLMAGTNLFCQSIYAHQSPNTIMLLDVQPDGVEAELQLPLSELELAFGKDLRTHSETLVARWGSQLQSYLLAHIRPESDDHLPWTVTIRDIYVAPAEQSYSGPIQELIVRLWLQPPVGSSSRIFTLRYDVIMHQVVTHFAIVSVRNDWETGIDADHPVELGAIRMDTYSGIILPLKINQSGGSWWYGCRNMIALGIKHIAEGTDHLLFLLTLLLPATLLAQGKRWGHFGGIKYSLSHLLSIITAFTIGHSLTLLAGVIGWLQLPSQPIEVLIAFSIGISAVHAWRPIFFGREVYVAGGFGLVHGLAFAGTLTSFNLAPGYMALSILSFNIGIELMQLTMVLLTIPWLILLSQTKLYSGFRIAGATFAAIAALAWMAERILMVTNPVTQVIETIAQFAPWIVLVLACVALFTYWWERRRSSRIV
ncbi:MAG TPA: HupE/UreJ family protein [Ohtaekwangia sp.]|uniref:HupE/UreJ family protein n=1 Tax=Ohtaekwangia sp. TaxID=2066019 RepID=UPI002F942255